MMKQKTLFSFSFFLFFLQHFPNTIAQSPARAPTQPMVPAPPAQSPSVPITQPPAASPTHLPPPPAPTNVTNILEKAGHFTVFIRLLKATQEDNHLTTVLNNSNNGLTLFVPSDEGFSSLKAGILNTLSDDQKSKLIKFHEIPMFLSNSQFQTVSNPIATEAGSGGRVAMNVTTSANSVNITTGLTNASVSGNVYSDNRLAIYRVDKVLLPMDIFTSKAPAPAPGPAKEKAPKKKAPAIAESPAGSNTTITTTPTTNTTGSSSTPLDVGDDVSGAVNHGVISWGVGLVSYGFAVFFL